MRNLSTTDAITEKLSFPCFHGKYCQGNDFFHHNQATYPSKLCLNRKQSLAHKDHSKSFSKRCIFNPIVKDLDPSNRFKMQQIQKMLQFWLFTIFVVKLSDLSCLICLIFLKSFFLNSQFSYFVLKTSLKGLY